MRSPSSSGSLPRHCPRRNPAEVRPSVCRGKECPPEAARFPARSKKVARLPCRLHSCLINTRIQQLILVCAATLTIHAALPDYEPPALLTGTIFARGSTNVLYLFKRTARRDGDTVRVVRDFTYPDGRLAARERVAFTAGKLASFQIDDSQIDAHGGTTAAPDPKDPRNVRLRFNYTVGSGGRTKTKTDSETAEGEVLVGDMIPYFIVSHWAELMAGQPAKFRFIAQDRLETVGFKLVKEGETTQRGTPVVRLRMEPTSVIIAAIVDPLHFLVEKDGTHRVLQYEGRTTPHLRSGNSWKDLDAVTVYDWSAR